MVLTGAPGVVQHIRKSERFRFARNHGNRKRKARENNKHPVCRVRQNSTRSRACKFVFRPLLLVNYCFARAPAILCSLANTVKSVYIKKEFLSDQNLISFDDIIRIIVYSEVKVMRI